MLYLEPLFVDRERELAEFAALLSDLARGRRRHLALLGLRRIGKTMLLDEVRRRHPQEAIAYLALDEVVSTPEDFARALLAETLRAAAITGGPLSPSNEDLRALARRLHPGLGPSLENLLSLLAARENHGALLMAALRFPDEVSRALQRPLLLMLDEFQDLVRLRAFPGTENLLGAVRAALDRPGLVAYTVAGSRVSAMRGLLGDSDSPLFTRFEPLELGPFSPEGSAELAQRLWVEGDPRYEPDALARLHRLSGGWPLYVHALAARAGQLARAGDGVVSPETVDIAFQQELFGRAANIGQNCRYLLETALRADADAQRNTHEAVLRQVARWQPLTRASLVRRLSRHDTPAQIYRAINRLIENDFIVESEGLLSLFDPVFAVWLTVEPARRDPAAAMADPSIRRLLVHYEAQHAQDRTTMGLLFERRIENLARQFRGQAVEGRLFGVEGMVALPTVRQAGRVRLDDPQGLYCNRQDTYDLDIVTTGEGEQDTWAIEAKHRRGAVTEAMVRRFLISAQAVARARGLRFARLWIVASRGIRPDALSLAQSAGAYSSGLRQVERLERWLAASFEETLPEEPVS